MRDERHAVTQEDPQLPPFTEQLAEQIGGWRGITESAVPVVAFVLANVVTDLRPAILVAVGVALAIAVVRLRQRRPVRYAVNGLVGVAVGAVIAWNTGEAKDFHLPAILYSLGYAGALLGSVALRQPLVGWIWSVVAAGGRSDWREDPRLLRAFGWLTVAWAAVYLLKAGVLGGLHLADQATALGIARVALGYPPYALLLAGTIWVARRLTRDERSVPAVEPGGQARSASAP
jgi:hypothetical protein